MGAGPRRGCLPETRPALDLGPGSGVRRLAVFRQLERLFVYGDQDQFWVRRVQRALHINEVLLILRVETLMDHEVNAETKCGERQHRHELARRTATRDGNPTRPLGSRSSALSNSTKNSGGSVPI